MSPKKYQVVNADNWGLCVRVHMFVQDQVLGELQRIWACTEHEIFCPSFCT